MTDEVIIDEIMHVDPLSSVEPGVLYQVVIISGDDVYLGRPELWDVEHIKDLIESFAMAGQGRTGLTIVGESGGFYHFPAGILVNAVMGLVPYSEEVEDE